MVRLHRISTMAQQVIKEAWYSRSYLLFLMIIVFCIALSAFAGELVLTGTRDTSLVIYNFAVRLGLVSVTSIHLIQVIQREKTDKQIDIMLALDVPRLAYILGRLSGFVASMLVVTLMAIVYPLWYAQIDVAIVWGMSLFIELCIIISFSLFVAISINNTAACFSLVICGYLLARNIGNLVLLSESPIIQDQNMDMEWIRAILDLINLLLPDIWRYAQSEWLITGNINIGSITLDVLVAILFCLVLVTATTIDLYRKNL